MRRPPKALIMPEVIETVSQDLLKPAADETASHTILLSVANDMTYQAMLTPQTDSMAFHAMIKLGIQSFGLFSAHRATRSYKGLESFSVK